MRIIILTILLVLSYTGNSQSKINSALKKELDSIYIVDQKPREIFTSSLLQTHADSLAIVYNVPKDQLLGHLITKMNVTDSTNLLRVEQIIKQYGYPGISLVGTPTNEAVFFVIQHSKNIDEYLPLIKKAAEEKELKFSLYAMMLDRALMFKGKEQLYGTQVMGFEVVNEQTKQKEFVRFVWPIENPSEVNNRRKDAGFPVTVEENAKRLGVDYKVLTLDDVQKMRGN